MRRFDRTIQVFEGKHCKVEVEGKTVSVQWAFKDPNNPGQTAVAKGAMPMFVAAELALVLADAAAGAGEVINDNNMVVYTAGEPATEDSGRSDNAVPLADDAGSRPYTVSDKRRSR